MWTVIHLLMPLNLIIFLIFKYIQTSLNHNMLLHESLRLIIDPTIHPFLLIVYNFKPTE